ncbi:iron chelate uptake ABC transporter family permease subunit, partial [Microbacterium sp. NPDC055599]
MTETLRLDDATDPAAPERRATAVSVEAEGRGPKALLTGVGVLVLLAVLLVAVAGWHLTQGTSGAVLPPADVLWGSRIPRLAAGVAVGVALGVAGILLQSLARNALASPDTLGVTAGAYLAVTALAAFGIAVPVWASGAVAFAGGLVAAGIVLGLAGGAGSSTTRLILAGTALALAFQAGTSTLLILFDEETTGLLAWGSGSLSQLGLSAFLQAAPVVGVVTVLALVLARRLDILALGDDTASSLGVPIRSTRAIGILLAVTLTAVSVTLAGPMGFVGLCAPVLARLLSRVVPSLNRHLLLIPAAGLLGAIVVILADALLRALIGAEAAILIPTGVATTLLGAIVLVLMARRLRDAGPTREPPRVRFGVRSRVRFRVTLVVVALGVAGVLLLGLLAGHTW